MPRVAKGCACGIFLEFGSSKLESMEALVRARTMGVMGRKVEKSRMGGRASTIAGAGPTDLLYGIKVYLPPTATRGAWALMSPAQVDPG